MMRSFRLAITLQTAALALTCGACSLGSTEPSQPLPTGTYVAVRAGGQPVGAWITILSDSVRVVGDTIVFRADGKVRRRGVYVLGFGTPTGSQPVARDVIVPASLTNDGGLVFGDVAPVCPILVDCALVEAGRFAGDTVVLVSTWAQSVRNVVFVRRGE